VRLYFNLVNGSETLRDKEGIELRSRRNTFEVFKGIKEALAENTNVPRDWQGWRMKVVEARSCSQSRSAQCFVTEPDLFALDEPERGGRKITRFLGC